VAFDHAMTSFRNEIFPAYKAQRDEPPADLEPQFELCKQVTEALGVAAFERPAYEADDLLATLAAGLVRRGARVVIVSTDKDLAQLVREDGRVSLYDPAERKEVDADGVRARFGVDPRQIPDFLGLMGDAVDNLPGVPGVGAKSAVAALRAFGRIERIPADPEAWAGVAVRGARRIAGLVDAHRERALRTRELATVRRDVPGVQARLRTLRYRGAERRAVEALCERLGWGRIAARVPRWR
jgi:5'-3' exonuclease